MASETQPKVLAAWNAVLSDITNIGEDASNSGLRWNFRSIRTTMNTFGPLLRKHKLLPQLEWQYLGTETVGNTHYERVLLDLAVVSVEDGSKFVIVKGALGSAGDTQDKAGGKAMSYALKVALLQGGIVPVDEGDLEDSDYDNPHEAPAQKSAAKKKATAKKTDTASADLDKARKRTFAQLAELDVSKDKPTRLSYCNAIVEREVESSLDYTLAELQDLNKELAKRIQAAAKETK